MIGKKEETQSLFHFFDPNDLIPDDYILKRIDRHIDFSFIEGKVKHLYSHTGRRSVPPEVMLRMLMVGYLFGITSERTLCREVGMHVGYRWFAKLNMEEKPPHHSTFSKNRHGRFAGSGVWEEVFDEIVRRCIDAGLVRGKHLTADGTLVEADASLSSMEPVDVAMSPLEYLKKLNEQNPVGEDDDGDEPEDEYRHKGTKMSNATHRSTTDPDSRIARKGKYSATKLSYQTSYLMDNSSRVILDAAAGGECGRGAEMAAALAGLDRVKWKYKLKPETLGGDKGYAVGEFVSEVYGRGVTPHVPVWDTRGEHDRGIYPIEKFRYYGESDCFVCPGNKTLKYHGAHVKQHVYRAREVDCRGCRLKKKCTRGKLRTLSFHVDAEYIERAKEEKRMVGYKQSQRCRKKVEQLFGEAKEQMGMRRMKFRGRATVREQTLLTAAAQNIKRLVKFLERGVPKPVVVLKAAPPGQGQGLVEAVFGAILGFFGSIFGSMPEKCFMLTKTMPCEG